MGRNSTGAYTTGDCLRIELSYLLKAGYLIRGKLTSGTLSWNWNGQPTGSISIFCIWPIEPAKRPSIQLVYTVTDRTTGEKEDRNDTVYLEARPSNLGKGDVLYFICPSSGQRCRILYKAYGCPIWKSRQSYQHRIYYRAQQSSKREKANNRFWQLEDHIKKLQGKRKAGTYRGKPTKRAERIGRMEIEQWEANHQRWLPEAMTLGLRRAVFGALPGYEDLRR
ncbi:hypothetical protein GCM10027341_09660 [Spirosoma knui]